jgi:predicted enzyme related to lactoylglutathione lyase
MRKGGERVISHIGRVTLYVCDQDRAKAFYVDRLGFELRQDAAMGPPGGPRWLEVAPKGAQTALVLYRPTPELPGASSYALAESLIGTFAPFVLEVTDMEATASELMARGVAFDSPPSRQPYGWWATVRDPDGNTIGLHQS